MTLIIASSELPPLEFLSAVTGRPIRTRDRALEAAYLEAINAHHRAAKAASDAMVKRPSEDALDFLIRKLAPLYAHDDYCAEQARLWASGRWVAVVAPFLDDQEMNDILAALAKARGEA